MAPTKRTNLTWKEKVVILDKLKLLKHGTSQHSAEEQLKITGFGCFHNTVGIWRMNWPPSVFIIQPLISLWSGPGVGDITEFYCKKKNNHNDIMALNENMPFLGTRKHKTANTTRRMNYCRLRWWSSSIVLDWSLHQLFELTSVRHLYESGYF